MWLLISDNDVKNYLKNENNFYHIGIKEKNSSWSTSNIEEYKDWGDTQVATCNKIMLKIILLLAVWSPRDRYKHVGRKESIHLII